MKVKNLRNRIDQITRVLDDEDPEGFPSALAISQITGIASIFSTEAQIRLEQTAPLTVGDEWLLSAFRHTHLHAEFEDAFRRICEVDHDDFPRLYGAQISGSIAGSTLGRTSTAWSRGFAASWARSSVRTPATQSWSGCARCG